MHEHPMHGNVQEGHYQLPQWVTEPGNALAIDMVWAISETQQTETFWEIIFFFWSSLKGATNWPRLVSGSTKHQRPADAEKDVLTQVSAFHTVSTVAYEITKVHKNFYANETL